MALLLGACGGGGGGGSTSATVISIAISPDTTSIPVGLAQQYAVQATYSDGTTKAITGVTYTSSNTAVAAIAVGTEGSVMAKSAGTTTITASYQNQTATATLTVAPSALLSILISPATASIPAGTTQQFTATGNYSDGTTQAITTASWSSSSATVANIDSSGLATSVAAGNSNISVVYGGKAASASLTVTSENLLSIAVTPASASIVSGTTQQYSATGSYSDGTTKTISNPTWSSSLTSVATINASGLASAGTGSGNTNVTAMYGGQTASVPLTVTLATPVSLTITTTFGGATTLPLNSSLILLSAKINYSNGTSQATSTGATWSSSNTAVGTIWGTASVMPVGVGSTTITVTDAGLSGTIDITYTAPVPTSSSITGLDASTSSFAKRTSAQLSAQISYSNGSTAVPTTTTWSSSNTNVFTVDAAGLFVGVGPGTATLTLTADGLVRTRSITIVNPVATPSLVVTCNSAAPMTISAATWNAGYALDPKNASEWVTVDPVSCAAYPYVVLVVAKSATTVEYSTLQASRYSSSVFGPAITNTSTLTPQLSSGNKVTVGSTSSASNLFYTSIYSITAAP